MKLFLAGMMTMLALSSAQGSDVSDEAGLFSARAIADARAKLQAIEDRTGVETIIDTFPRAAVQTFSGGFGSSDAGGGGGFDGGSGGDF